MSSLDRDSDGSVPVTLVHSEIPTATCRCGHEEDAHEHFRSGSDCGACDCARYRRERQHRRDR